MVWLFCKLLIFDAQLPKNDLISVIDEQLWYSVTTQKMSIIMIMPNVISSYRNVALEQLEIISFVYM